ncbi:chorismate mutase [Mycolicibacterium flavescens]|uniref:Chorismate mutase n=1 Tax=Mycolicibacterium flavescens TaxID=1776 RepID=A0A1E3RE04_MYCFV|nr:chorismate mutase [Mycolicibacterium flavescens]MCV7280770.1 chorismate mutase [Mycolicibacterium flavescens]ODQ88115.1 chorismate mutase [Mycolicibacterium flavescens]
MRILRTAVLIVVSLFVALPQATAVAQPASPLYPLVDAAAQRLETADPIAAAKWITGGPLTDKPRAEQVLDSVAAAADAHGIDRDYVRDIFRNQIDATEGIEYTRFGQWKFDPASAPVTAPDLSQSRAEIDRLNTKMVDEIAAQWNSLHSPECTAAVASATQAVGDARRFDPLYRQALASATRSYCPRG